MPTAAERAYDRLRNGILDGRYTSGAHLTETAVAMDMGVSRTPVREALRRLSQEGFVEFHPNQGAFVSVWGRKSLADLAEVRAELAALAGRLAALRIEPGRLQELEAVACALDADIREADAAARQSWVDDNLAFHRIVFEIAGNDWLAQMFEQTTHAPVMQQTFHAFGPDDWAAISAYYRELIAALREGDGEWAMAVMRNHFLSSRRALLAAYERMTPAGNS